MRHVRLYFPNTFSPTKCLNLIQGLAMAQMLGSTEYSAARPKISPTSDSGTGLQGKLCKPKTATKLTYQAINCSNVNTLGTLPL